MFAFINICFKVLPREIRSWALDEILNITNTCVILHTLIDRMQQNGTVRDEVGGEKLIKEFLNRYEQERTEAEIEYEDIRRRRRLEVVINWEEQVVGWIVNDMQYTYFEAF